MGGTCDTYGGNKILFGKPWGEGALGNLDIHGSLILK
jgi:hypothetical protein